MKNKYEIKIKRYTNGSYDSFGIFAVDYKGEKIFGADATVSRIHDYKDGKYEWSQWRPSWGSVNYETYELMLPVYDSISVAMRICEALIAGKEVSDKGEF